jgi:hypothetical protein
MPDQSPEEKAALLAEAARRLLGHTSIGTPGGNQCATSAAYRLIPGGYGADRCPPVLPLLKYLLTIEREKHPSASV